MVCPWNGLLVNHVVSVYPAVNIYKNWSKCPIQGTSMALNCLIRTTEGVSALLSIMSWKVFTQSLKYKILPYTVQFINSVIQLHSCIICDVRLVYKLIAFWGAAQPFRSLLNVLEYFGLAIQRICIQPTPGREK